MCGISAILSKTDNINIALPLISTIIAMEYRGYDSAGASLFMSSTNSAAPHEHQDDGSHIHEQRITDTQTPYNICTYRTLGRTSKLQQLYTQKSTPNDQCSMGIAHTRWATHGAPSINNTHPIQSGDVIIVHNGVIENYRELKQKIPQHTFHSDTDTEVIAALISHKIAQQKQSHHNISQAQIKIQAISAAMSELEGRFSCVIAFKDNPKEMFGVCRGLSLIFAKNSTTFYLLSDITALPTGEYELLTCEDGDIIQITQNSYKFIHRTKPLTFQHSIRNNQKTELSYEHHMYHEILEQPRILNAMLHGYQSGFSNINFDLYDSLHILACGSSYNAGLYAKHIIEADSKIKVNVEIASEFSSREQPLSAKTLYIFISQSGETADTLLAIDKVQSLKLSSLAIVNSEHSQLERKADHTIMLNAGKETSVASTKAFTAQLLLMYLLKLEITHQQKVNNTYIAEELTLALNKALAQESRIAEVAAIAKTAQFFVFTGKGKCYVSAVEACLKMQELTYIPSMAFASGEFKHGPLALVDEKPLIIFIASENDRCAIAKASSQVNEIAARNARIILFGSQEAIDVLQDKCLMTIQIPVITTHEISEIISALPLQLLAYHTAKILERNVDQPRNLAKSVTVE